MVDNSNLTEEDLTINFTSASHPDGFEILWVQIQFKQTTFLAKPKPADFFKTVQEIAPKLNGSFVVILYGKIPDWAFGLLIQAAQAAEAVAIVDYEVPLTGAIVVQSHCDRFQLGEAIVL